MKLQEKVDVYKHVEGFEFDPRGLFRVVIFVVEKECNISRKLQPGAYVFGANEKKTIRQLKLSAEQTTAAPSSLPPLHDEKPT